MFKVLTNGCEPERATKYSTGIDVFSAEDVVISAGETVMFGLGIKIDNNKIERIISHYYYYLDENMDKDFYTVKDEFMKSHYLQLMLSRSLGSKGLILPNGIGVIDLDYLDELKMIVHNPVAGTFFYPTIDDENYFIGGVIILEGIGTQGDGEYKIKKGDKVGQITLMEHKGYLMGYESDVERTGGIGSTGN